ncbi:MAG TPA: isochorismatase family cysteine hydrolase [Gemmatimonadales bacterium]
METVDLDWRRQVERLPGYAPREPLSRDHTALLIVDMQYGSAHRDGTTGWFLARHYPELYRHYFDRLEQVVVPAIADLIDDFRAHGRDVIYLTVGSHLPDGRDFESLRRDREAQIERETGQRSVINHVRSRGVQVLESLAPRDDELVLNKVTRSGFTSTGLDRILRNLGVTCLVVTGVATNSCVLATAIGASDLGYLTVMVEDGCGALSPQLQHSALQIFAHNYGRVLKAGEVKAELSGRA